MKKKEYKFSINIRELKIRTISSDVFIHNGDVEQPVVLNAGNFEISEEGKSIFIKEGRKKGNNIINDNGAAIRIFGNTFQDCSFNSVQIGNVTVNGRNINISTITGNPTSLEIVIPKSHGTLSLYVQTTSGDIDIEDLTMSKLLLESTSGDLVLSNVDLLNGDLHSVSGDINAKIRNSQCNYKTSLWSLSGDIRKSSEERESKQTPSQNISTLNAKTVSGDIKILFKGKRK